MKSLIVVIGLLFLFVGCGLFGPSPGEAACNQFNKSIIDWRQGDLNTFEFRKELGKVQEKAASAEPKIQVAADHLVYSANTVSEDRLDVSIEIMGEECARLGYLSKYAF